MGGRDFVAPGARVQPTTARRCSQVVPLMAPFLRCLRLEAPQCQDPELEWSQPSLSCVVASEAAANVGRMGRTSQR